MSSENKIRSLEAAIALIPDGATVALGAQRPPMAALRELVRQGRRRLVLAGGADAAVAALRMAGCVDRVEPFAVDRLRAAALGLTLLPVLEGEGEPVRIFIDPFSGQATRAVPALRPHFAILHAHAADCSGNVQIGADAVIAADELAVARAAERVIVTVEQIVSDLALARRPGAIVLAATEVACVVEAPFGAYPFACDGRYVEDPAALARLDHDDQAADHWAYLDRVGARNLLGVSLNRVAG